MLMNVIKAAADQSPDEPADRSGDTDSARAQAIFYGQPIAIPDDGERPCLVGDSVWLFPGSLAPGPDKSRRTIDFTSISHERYSPLLYVAKQSLMALKQDLRGKRRRLSTIVSRSFWWKNIVLWVTENGFSSLGMMSMSDADRMIEEIGGSWKNGTGSFVALLSEINEQGRKGKLADWFKNCTFGNEHFRRRPKGGDGLSVLYGDALPLPAPAVDISKVAAGTERSNEDSDTENDASFQPFPDECVAATLERVRIYTSIAAHVAAHVANYVGCGRDSHAYREFARTFKWRSSDGRELRELPFEANYQFPPRNANDLRDLLTMTEAAILFLAGICLGARFTELLTIRVKTITSRLLEGTSLTTIDGATFKVSAMLKGDPKQWPIPERLATALRQLENIYSCMPGTKPNIVWRQTRLDRLAMPLDGTTCKLLKSFFKRHGLEKFLGSDQSVNTRRFRPTVVGMLIRENNVSLKALQELLGHKQISSTVGYVMASPFIREELARRSNVSFESRPNNPIPLQEAAEYFVLSTEANLNRHVDDFVATGFESASDVARMRFPGILCNCAAVSQVPKRKCIMCEFIEALPSDEPIARVIDQFVRKRLKTRTVQASAIRKDWLKNQTTGSRRTAVSVIEKEK
jgi:integrase